MAKTTKTGAAKAPKPAPKAEKRAPEPVDPPFVAEAKAIWDGLDERTRTARSLNCLMHGHPAGVTIADGESGVFCPHCCTWLAEPGS